MDKKQSVITNFIWRLMERGGTYVVNFAVSVVLARLLAPELFGQVVLLQTVIDFFVLVIENGVNTSLIQSSTVAERLQNIISRKRISRCMRAVWMELKPLNRSDTA